MQLSRETTLQRLARPLQKPDPCSAETYATFAQVRDGPEDSRHDIDAVLGLRCDYAAAWLSSTAVLRHGARRRLERI